MAEKKIPWYLAGSSLSATKLSADTPIIVCAMVYSYGLSGNWIWWGSAPALVVTALFFARLWHRSGANTELELLSLRYGNGRKVNCLRACKAFVEGGLFNAGIIASVTMAFHHVLQYLVTHSTDNFILSLFPNATVLTVFVFLLVGIYTFYTGLRGVIFSDLFQLIFALGITWLMVYFLLKDNALPSLLQSLPNGHLHFFSVADTPTGEINLWLFLVIAWAYRAAGTGPLVQRILACRNESDAVKALGLHCIIHFVLRSWPWIIIGMAAVPLLGDVTSADVFVSMALTTLPPAVIDLFILCLLAAYASTLDSQLNWGAALLANDAMPRPVSTRGYHICVLCIAVFSLAIYASDIVRHLLFVYEYIMLVMVGCAPVAICRWYWWRTSINGEWLSYLSSLLTGTSLFIFFEHSQPFWYSLPMLLNLLVGVVIVIVTSLKQTDTPDHVAAFFATLKAR